ncbi:MAG: hypothetical protein ACYS8K_09310 [Planctomycetota bacterium]|jgi:DNA topoisomerase-6 subunit A
MGERKSRASIQSCAEEIKAKIDKKRKPSLKFPKRSLSNVAYDEEEGYFKLKEGRITRTLTYNTVKTFAQTLRMMALAKEAIDAEEEVTKREAYYVSKNWGEARFDEQPESDTVMEDIEALFRVNREQLGFIPEEKGGEVAGELRIIPSGAPSTASWSLWGACRRAPAGASSAASARRTRCPSTPSWTATPTATATSTAP